VLHRQAPAVERVALAQVLAQVLDPALARWYMASR
jgi:hypothetical protein